jgi:hypothetical protein
MLRCFKLFFDFQLFCEFPLRIVGTFETVVWHAAMPG